jgi:hypothetical protein
VHTPLVINIAGIYKGLKVLDIVVIANELELDAI